MYLFWAHPFTSSLYSSSLQANLYIAQTKIAHVCGFSVKYVSDTRLNIYQQDQMYCARSLHVVSNRIFRVNKFRVDK